MSNHLPHERSTRPPDPPPDHMPAAVSASDRSGRPDTSHILPVALSLPALIVAIWAANEARQTRLDTRRAQLRGESHAFLREVRSSVNMFNCYALVRGVSLEGKDSFMQSLYEYDQRVREGLSGIADFSADPLTTYEKYLNGVQGQAHSLVGEQLVVIRNSWDRDLREKADSVCRT